MYGTCVYAVAYRRVSHIRIYLLVSYLLGLVIADETCPPWQETPMRDEVERNPVPCVASIIRKLNVILVLSWLIATKYLQVMVYQRHPLADGMPKCRVGLSDTDNHRRMVENLVVEVAVEVS